MYLFFDNYKYILFGLSAIHDIKTSGKDQSVVRVPVERPVNLKKKSILIM